MCHKSMTHLFFQKATIDTIYQLIAKIFRLSIIKVLSLQPKSKLQIRK